MKFNVGQKVVFLRDQGGGVVKSIDDQGRYVVLDEDGFSRAYLSSEIAPVLGEDYKISDDIISIIKEEAIQSKSTHVTLSERDAISNRGVAVWEIDLHIEQLVESYRDLTHAEILKKQMNAFRTFFNKGCSQSIRKMIVIHGVGEGVLKFEIRSFLDKLDGVYYYDADYADYGKGATTIEVRYSE